ncbi:MAG: EF-P 5-aminopentanol modification-associated protein YfmH [Acutalibacteraceae bacterium]
MIKKEFYSPIVKEKYYKYILDCGLELYIFPKHGQSSNYAIFGTRFGSVYTDFTADGKNEYHVPQGIAHYLEHKMFESEEGDAFERFTKTGAHSNAYTSFDRTRYLFECSDNFYESYDILLDFVQSPYFTDQTVLKEQGIIGQEIRMYEDTGSWQVLMNALRAMYYNNPVNIDIAGTVEEIAKITAKDLYDCYNTYYNLNNMFICICGNVNEDEVLEFTQKRLRKLKKIEAKRIPFEEPDNVKQKEISCNLEVSIPQFVIAYKEKLDGEFVENKKRIMMAMLLDIISSQKSGLYSKMLNEGLINSGFCAEVFDGTGYLSCMFSGESKDPYRVRDMIFAEIEKVRLNGIDETDFETTRRAFYGDEICRYNSVTSVTDMLVNGAVCGYDCFENLEIIKSVTSGDLNNLLKEILDQKTAVISVVNPVKNSEE